MKINEKNKILVVDDVAINREILIALLEDKYEVLEAEDGEVALKIIDKNFHSISLILLDLMMPGIDGFQVLETLNKSNYHIPVIIITANSELEQEKHGLELGAVDFIPKPFDPDIVRYRVDTHVKLRNYQYHLETLVEQNVERMAERWASMVQSMAEIIEYRNQESGLHVKRTSILSKMLLQQMNKNPKLGYYCSQQDVRIVYEAASLHDIGKISIPDSILLKPGKLTDEEFEIMKTHTKIGFEISEKINRFTSDDYRNYCGQITLCHHEKWDGTGYPAGLKRDEIPLAARVVAIADTYDAITNDRPYRPGAPHEKAVAVITDMKGKQFDPYLVDVFLEIENEVKHTFKFLKE